MSIWMTYTGIGKVCLSWPYSADTGRIRIANKQTHLCFINIPPLYLIPL